MTQGQNNTAYYHVKLQANNYNDVMHGNGSINWLPIFFFPPNHTDTVLMLQIKKIENEWKFYTTKLTKAAKHQSCATLSIYTMQMSPHPQEQYSTDPCEYTTNIAENASRRSVLTLHNDFVRVMHHSRNNDSTMTLFTCTLYYTAQ